MQPAIGWNGPRRPASGTCACRVATRHGRAATVNMTIAVSSLFGLDDLPGDLDGFGPVMAGAVRQVAGRSTLFRVLTDDTGAPLAYGRTRYRPGPELVEHVAVRDVTCRFPTCGVPARACDVDHRRPWDDGGSTDPGNTWALHRGHHLGKTHHGFRAVVDPGDGSVRWITPAGRSYPVESDLAGIDRPQRHRPPPDLDPPPF